MMDLSIAIYPSLTRIVMSLNKYAHRMQLSAKTKIRKDADCGNLFIS
jgi:hypothetical protein